MLLSVWECSGFFISPSKKYKPAKQAGCCTRNLQKIVWNSGCLDYSELPNIILSNADGEYFGKRAEKCKIPGRSIGMKVENLEDHSCPKVQGLADEEIWICSKHPVRQKTTLHVHSSRQICLVTRYCVI